MCANPLIDDVRELPLKPSPAVAATIIGGQVVWSDGEYAPGYGREFASGRFLPSGETVTPRPAPASRESVAHAPVTHTLG